MFLCLNIELFKMQPSRTNALLSVTFCHAKKISVRLHDALSEKEHLELIQLAMELRMKLRATEATETKFIKLMALMQLTLSKEVCIKFVNCMRDGKFLVDCSYFSLDVMNQCVFRFITPETPAKLLKAALIVIKVSWQLNLSEKTLIRSMTTGLLKELAQSGHQGISFKRLKKKTRTPRRRQ